MSSKPCGLCCPRTGPSGFCTFGRDGALPGFLRDALRLAQEFDQSRLARGEVIAPSLREHERERADVPGAAFKFDELSARQPSVKVVAQAFTGGRPVKGFNHLPAGILGQDPAVHGGRRVVFLASDDDCAAAEIAVLAENLGFAPIKLGGLSEGGLLVQGRGNSWGQLIFKDLVKFD